MNIYVYKLSKEKLEMASPIERSFFIVIAHLANEINILHKLILWSIETNTQNLAEENGRITLIFMFLRLLAGKLYEGNVLLEEKYYGKKISRDYDPTLCDEYHEARKNIKRYFKSSNAVKHIRNNYAFHYSPDEIDQVLPSVSEELEMYVSTDESANTLFYFSEVLVNRAILKNIEASDDLMAYNQLISEIPKVAGWFLILAEFLVVEFLSRQGNDIWDGVAEKVEFKHLRSITDVEIPFFTDTSNIMNAGPNPPGG